MPDKFLIRRKLLEHLGRRRYIKFVRSLSRILSERPMRYWQEEEWDRFCKANPDLATPSKYLPYLLRYCMIHGCDLELFPVKTTSDEIDYEPWPNPPLIRAEVPPLVMMMGPLAKTIPVVPYWSCPVCTETRRQGN